MAPVTNAFPARTASSRPRPIARYAATALASVQPVPWV